MDKKRKLRDKLLSIALSLMVMVTFVPLLGGTVYAEEITYTNCSENMVVEDFPNNYGPVISSDKAEYNLGENIYIKVENSSSATSGGWIGIYKDLGANSQTTTEVWAYTGNSTVDDVTDFVIYGPDKNSAVTVNTDLGNGTYYIILMADDGRWAVLPITITAEPSSFSTDKTRYKVGEPINVSTTSLYSGAWVGYYPYLNEEGGDVNLESDLIDYYYPKDKTNPYNVLDCVQDDANKAPGHYKVILFTGGYDIDRGADGNLLIRSFYIEHYYADPKWDLNDDCTEATATFECVDDESVTAKTITVSGENLTSEVTKEATCKNPEETTYTATISNVDFLTESGETSFTGEIVVATKDPLGHNMEAHPAVDATCGDAGNSAYWYCDRCETYYSDAEGNTEIEKDSWVIPATGEHTWKDATCTTPKTCEVCGETEGEALGHKWNDGEVTKEATCTEKGEKTFTCTVCGETKAEEIDAVGHNWEKVTNPAGLLKNGSEFEQCTLCGEKQNEVVLKGYATYYVKSFKVSKGKKSFTAKWKKQSSKNQKKFNGYQIRYSTKSNMSGYKTATAKKSSKSKTIKKLKKKTTYYVQVRTYTKKNGVTYYSKWSSKKSVKTK